MSLKNSTGTGGVLMLNYQFNVVGGMEKSCWITGRIFQKMGYLVQYGQFLASKKPNSYPHSNKETFSLEETPSRNPASSLLKIFTRAWRISKFCNWRGIRTVISNGEICNFSTILANRVFGGKFKTFCVIHNSPSYYVWSLTGKVFTILMRFLYPLAYKIVCVSEEMEMDLRRKLHLSDGKTATIYNPIEKSRLIEPGQKEQNRPFAFVHVGRLDSVKNQKFIIDAFDRYRNNNAWKLKIIGDWPLRNELEEYARSLPNWKDIAFAWALQDVEQELANADCFLFASLNEGFGRAPIEALSAWVPVVSHDYQFGAKEILRWENWSNEPCTEIEMTPNWALVPYMDMEAFVEAMKLISERRFDTSLLHNQCSARFWEESVLNAWRRLLQDESTE